jgi:hypothetical protein
MRSTAPLNSSWSIAAFAVFGAFILCGFGGAVIAEALGIWSTPVAGFTSAFAVVAIAHLVAPKYKAKTTLLVFVAGCIIAWWLLWNSYYPESYEEKAYMPTHIPFLTTVAGGAVALIICFFPVRSPKSDT